MFRKAQRFFVFSALILLGTLAPAQRDTPKNIDPDPEIERKSFQLADGFEANLYAADPLLAKPVQMNFDAAGRLWIASSHTYPQIKPGQKADDKIIVLEDTDGDGKADKTTIFADGLLIPTGIEPGDGGVYVANSTELLHFRDSKGAGKADQRRVVLSGFGTEDTHHMLHTLRWGHDGMLYMNQSIYIHSHIETPHGVSRLNGGGIWQFRTETLQLGVFMYGLCNPWGHHFDRWGQSFATDGAGGEGVNFIIPRGYYFLTPYPQRTFPGLNPGQPKLCGHEIVSGRHLPDSWQGDLITNDFRGHRVCRFKLVPDGAGYASVQQTDLIRSNHPAFRPIDVKMGPDGAIYIADWFNPIIQHGEVDFRDPRRDQTRGRIWRITAKGRPLVPRPKLVDAKTEDLLEALKSPEGYTRHFAKRVLKERGPVVLPALAAWVAKIPAPPENEPHLVEALWTYQSLDKVEPKLLATLLLAHDYRVRAAAVRVVSQWHDRLSNPLEMLAARVADEHPQVRLEAVRALGTVAGSRPVELALAALDRPVDRFLDYGLYLTLKEREADWMTALRQGKFDFGGNARRLVYALQAIGSPAVVGPLVELLQAGKVPAEGEEGVLGLIAALGGPVEMRLLFDRFVVTEGVPEKRRADVLRTLARATRQRHVRPSGDLQKIGEFLKSGGESQRAAAAEVAGLWKLEVLRPTLVELARDPKTPPRLQHAALDSLASLGGPASRDALAALTKDGQPASRRAATIALTAVDVDAAANAIVDVLGIPADEAAVTEVFDAFLQRKNGADRLAVALAGRSLPTDVARLGVRAIRSTGREAPTLVEALTKAGKLTFGARTLSPAEMRQTVSDVARLGDPARGEAVYRRKDQICQKCHSIAGAGGQVGPDLSSIGASAQVDYLVESLLLPSKQIKENYHTLLVSTATGKIFSGIKVRQTETELVLRGADDKEIAIPRKDIDETAQGGSLMPDGLTDTLTRGEFLDLVRFLSELGKVGPYAPTKARLVRRWEVARPRNGDRDDPSNLKWETVYSKADGRLPLGELPRLEGATLSPSERIAVRFQVDVSTPGRFVLKWSPVPILSVQVGDRPPVEDATTLDLPAGPHTLAVRLAPTEKDDHLRCELEDAPGSAARVRIVGGK